MKPLQRIRNWSVVLHCDRSRNMCFILCTYQGRFYWRVQFWKGGPKTHFSPAFSDFGPVGPSLDPPLPLGGLWCPRQAFGALDKTEGPLAGPWVLWLVSMAGLWCSWQVYGALVLLEGTVVPLEAAVVPLEVTALPLTSLWCTWRLAGLRCPC